MDERSTIEHNFHCLATDLANNAIFLFISGCGMSFLSLGLIAGVGMGLCGAFLLAVTPYIYVTYLTVKAIQRARLRTYQEDGYRYKIPQLSMVDIMMILAGLPTESFVPDSNLHLCSEEQLEGMLVNRQSDKKRTAEMNREQSAGRKNTPREETKSLIDAVRRSRKYNASCCICLEEYQAGDSVRVLPGCHHEFHGKCIEKWALTFVTCKAKQMARAKPTCPLCVTSLCRPCTVRVS